MEQLFCHFQNIDGVSVPCDPPRVFKITEEKRQDFDEFATVWGSQFRAGVLVFDDVTGEVASVSKHPCGLGCACAAIFEIVNVSVTVEGE